MIDLTRTIQNGSPNVENSRNIQRSYAQISKTVASGKTYKNSYSVSSGSVRQNKSSTKSAKTESVEDKRERRVSMFASVDSVYMDSIMVGTGIPALNDGFGF